MGGESRNSTCAQRPEKCNSELENREQLSGMGKALCFCFFLMVENT